MDTGRRGWVAVPTIQKWVAVDLSSPGIPGWQAVERALSLPEIRAFATAAAFLGLDVTAPAGEWTSTCVVRYADHEQNRFRDGVLHHANIRRSEQGWEIVPRLRGSILWSELPPSGWAVARNGAWLDHRTGLPMATTTDIDPQHADALSRTGYSYFWEPEHTEEVTIVIRECERLKDQIMDICAAMSPGHSHPDIRLREWMRLAPDAREPRLTLDRPDE